MKSIRVYVLSGVPTYSDETNHVPIAVYDSKDEVNRRYLLELAEADYTDIRTYSVMSDSLEMPRFVAELRRRWPRELVGLALRLQEAEVK